VLQRDEGRRLFGLDPAGYEAGRPEYPTYVYDVLVTRCGLRPGCRVLEIGPGTGLVTRHLLMDGARVTAVEPDLMLAEYLMAACPHVGVVGAPFEDALIPEATYDLAVAATSFHWVEQELGLAKLGRALKTGGWVALWWTLFRDPGHPDSFAEAWNRYSDPRLAAPSTSRAVRPSSWTRSTESATLQRGQAWSTCRVSYSIGLACSAQPRPERSTPRWQLFCGARSTNRCGYWTQSNILQPTSSAEWSNVASSLRCTRAADRECLGGFQDPASANVQSRAYVAASVAKRSAASTLTDGRVASIAAKTSSSSIRSGPPARARSKANWALR